MNFSISGISEALAARRGDTEYSKRRRKELEEQRRQKQDSKNALRKSLGRGTAKDEAATALEEQEKQERGS